MVFGSLKCKPDTLIGLIASFYESSRKTLDFPKTTSISSIMVSIKSSLSEEHSPLTVFLENIHASQILWINLVRMWNWSDFPVKQTCLSQKPVAAFHSPRYQSTFSILLKSNGSDNCCLWFLAKQILLAENAKNYLYVWHNANSIFQDDPLNFLYQSLRQPICNRRASRNSNFLGNFSSETFLTAISGKCRSFWFFLKIKPFDLKFTGCILSIRVSIDFFLLLNCYLIARQCISLLSTG